MADEKKRRGRPPLTDEQRELRRIENNKRQAERHKSNGYAAEKRYRENHPDRVREQWRKQNEKKKGSTYEPKVRIPIANKPLVEELMQNTGLSFTRLCLTAIEEKYGVKLSKTVDNTKK